MHVMQNAILFTVDDVSNVDMTSYRAFFFLAGGDVLNLTFFKKNKQIKTQQQQKTSTTYQPVMLA